MVSAQCCRQFPLIPKYSGLGADWLTPSYTFWTKFPAGKSVISGGKVWAPNVNVCNSSRDIEALGRPVTPHFLFLRTRLSRNLRSIGLRLYRSVKKLQPQKLLTKIQWLSEIIQSNQFRTIRVTKNDLYLQFKFRRTVYTTSLLQKYKVKSLGLNNSI